MGKAFLIQERTAGRLAQTPPANPARPGKVYPDRVWTGICGPPRPF